MVYPGSCCLGNARRRYSQGVSFPLGWTLELCEELLGSIGSCTVRYKQLSTDQEGAALSVDGSSTVNGQPPVWKAAELGPENRKTLTEEGKNKSTQWLDLHAVFLAVMGDLNSGKSHSGFLQTPGQWPMAWPYGQVEEQWKPGPLQECPYRGTALWKSLWKFEGCIKVEHADAFQKNPLPGSGGDWNRRAAIPVCWLKVATGVHEMSGHGGTAAMQTWAKSRHSPLALSEAQNANKNCSVCQQRR